MNENFILYNVMFTAVYSCIENSYMYNIYYVFDY